jgi:hypothetical protein
MRHGIGLAVLALVLVVNVADARKFTAPQSDGNTMVTSRPFMVKLLGLPRLHRASALSSDVASEEGRRVLYFPIGETAAGLFVKVKGSVEFERALIGNADGSVDNVDAYGVSRESGLFELANFENDRQVQWVRLVLRARSRHANVGVIIGR